jgi:hypothetical protein
MTALTDAVTAIAVDVVRTVTWLPRQVIGVTDPRSWPASDWAADIIPYVVFGMVTSAIHDGLSRTD